MHPHNEVEEQSSWPCFAPASFLMVVAARRMSAAENALIEIYTSALEEAERMAGADQGSISSCA